MGSPVTDWSAIDFTDPTIAPLWDISQDPSGSSGLGTNTPDPNQNTSNLGVDGSFQWCDGVTTNCTDPGAVIPNSDGTCMDAVTGIAVPCGGTVGAGGGLGSTPSGGPSGGGVSGGLASLGSFFGNLIRSLTGNTGAQTSYVRGANGTLYRRNPDGSLTQISSAGTQTPTTVGFGNINPLLLVGLVVFLLLLKVKGKI